MAGIYLDNNATTRVDPAVVAEMLPFLTEHFGNPSSIHGFGGRVAERMRWARAQVQALLGAEHDSEIVFTSGGTESNSTAIWSALNAYPERRELITSMVEHPAILAVCDHLEKHEGYLIHRIAVDSRGRLDLNAYAKALSPRVALATIMTANNETGTLFPVARLAALAREAGVLFHTDAVQAVGKIALDLKSTAIDLVSVSGHKLHAPKGVGVLYVRRGTRFRPLLRGGHQERGRRAGTENAPGIIALGRAAELAQAFLTNEATRVRALRDRLEAALVAQTPNCFVVGDVDARLPNTSTIAFEFIEGEGILLMLNQAGIAASSGSACTSGSLEPSHVLRAMKVPFTAAHGAIRFSLSRETTADEIETVIAETPAIIARLRGLSPYWSARGTEAAGFQPAYN